MQERISNRLLKILEKQEKAYEVFDLDMPGFILRVEASGVCNYYVRFRLADGSRKRLRLGSTSALTPAQARDMARDALASAAQGSDPTEARKDARGHTLRSFLKQEYRPWALTNRKSGAKTSQRLESSFKEFLDTRLSDLHPLLIERWRSKKLKKGRTAATTNRDLAHLRAALNRAVEWGILETNPIAKVKLHKEDTHARVRFLDDKERARLMAALDAHEEEIRAERGRGNDWRRDRRYALLPDLRAVTFADHLRPMVMLSLHLGLRRGELFDLEWTDIDFEQKTLTVRGGVAKSGRTRRLPMNAVAMRTLADWKTQTTGQGLVFANVQGRRFNNVHKGWRALMKSANIVAFRWHDMRHDFASRLVQSGCDLNTVRELLGHSDLKMTLRYSHLSPKVKADAVARLEEHENVVSLEARRTGR